MLLNSYKFYVNVQYIHYKIKKEKVNDLKIFFAIVVSYLNNITFKKLLLYLVIYFVVIYIIVN